MKQDCRLRADMSDPLPPLPEPFAPAPRPLRGPGCGRGALIGCGVLIALFGIGAVALTLNADKMLVWILQHLEAKVEAKLPPDLTPAERQRLPAAFQELYRAVGEGKVQPSSVQSLQRELFAVSGDVDRGLTREQVLRLVAAVEEAAGHPPPPEQGTPPATAGPPSPATPSV
jgi:hypothetical protein